LADALDRATTDEALRSRVADAARRHARTWQLRAEEISSFVDEVVG
jgi:hypothetical protein